MSMQSQSATVATPSFWSSVRESLRGSHQDFTTGNLNRAIILLAIPMVLEMVLESLFAVVDVFWVGRLGADAIATVGFTESLLSLVMAIGFGLSLSTTAMVARRIGEKDPAGAAVAGVQAIVIGFAIAVLIGIPCLFYASDLLRLMGASPQVVAVGSGYARIALGGSAAQTVDVQRGNAQHDRVRAATRPERICNLLLTGRLRRSQYRIVRAASR